MSKRPLRPQLVVRAGVTGHRELPSLSTDALLETVQETLGEIRAIAQEALAGNRDLFDSEQQEPVLRIVSSLANGADRLVAREARRQKYDLHAPLPFPREIYRQDPELGSVEEFQGLLDEADKVFELDSSTNSEEERKEGYEAVGRLVLRQSDVLIAIWDGKPERGTGGTGQIVQEALAVEIPTLRIDSQPPHEVTLLNPRRPPSSSDDDKRPRCVKDLLRERLLQTLLPQSKDPEERHSVEQAAARFFSEKQPKGWHAAPELPVELCHKDDGILRTAFEWADNHANLYAFNYRWSYRLIYLLGALAVLLAYLGSTAEKLPAGFPREHWVFLGAEFAAILIIGTLALLGWMRRSHERWLDYRHLAESLRMMRLLILVGRVTSYFQVPAHLGKGDPRETWFHFYLRALVRQAGLVAARIDEPYRKVFRDLLHESIRSQKKYHKDKAACCHLIHKVWHSFAQALFGIAAVACVLHFWVHGDNGNPGVLALNLAVIVLPAFGGAIGAILHHGESGRIMRRSEALEKRLEDLEAELGAHKKTPSARDLGRLAEDFSRICLAELMDWRFLFLDRPLVLPA